MSVVRSKLTPYYIPVLPYPLCRGLIFLKKNRNRNSSSGASLCTHMYYNSNLSFISCLIQIGDLTFILKNVVMNSTTAAIVVSINCDWIIAERKVSKSGLITVDSNLDLLKVHVILDITIIWLTTPYVPFLLLGNPYFLRMHAINIIFIFIIIIFLWEYSLNIFCILLYISF